MSEAEILEFIAGIKNGKMSEQDALKYLKNYPFDDIGCAKIDTQRALRNGTGEVIYGANKTDDEILQIASAIGEKNENILITRTNESVFKRICEIFPQANFNARGRAISVKFKEPAPTKSYIAIVSAGTADGAVVEEAYETAKFLGKGRDRPCWHGGRAS